MIHRVKKFLALLAPCVLAVIAGAQQGDAGHLTDLETVAERTGFDQTGTSEDVLAFLRALDARSDRTFLSSIGTSNEGRDLALMVIADPPVRSPEEARKSGKLVVLLFGNIHAGEVCGKEALQMLAREFALGDRSPLLDDIVLCLVPNYNPDGNDRMGPDNRRGQNGPREMGERHNAQDLDLNRDWIKMEAPETRALVRFMNQWDPAVIVDTHTTNGSQHRYVITYQGNKHPAGDGDLLSFVRDTYLPAVDARFEAQTDYNAFWYGNFEDKHTTWTTYPGDPRYGTPYRGMRNRIAILSEAYAYATFEDRVLGTREFCRAIVQEAAARKDEIRRLIRQADERTIARGRSPSAGDEVPLVLRVRAFEKKETALGVQEYDDAGARIPPTGEPRDYEVDLINDFVPEFSVALPWGYVIPEHLTPVVELLQRHGIEVEEIREDMECESEIYRIDALTRADRAFQGHAMVRIDGATPRPRTLALRPGMFLVRTGQRLGTLAAYMLEPRSTDGLASWNFFDDDLGVGGDFVVARLPSETPVTRRGARPLEEDRPRKQRLTYDMLFGSGQRPSLDGSPARVSGWLDGEHYLQTKDGQVRKVHAATGRVSDVDRDLDAIAENLARLSTISRDQARQIARRSFSHPNGAGVVFEHAGDLYHAHDDGTGARRLTHSPLDEEVWQRSPDGRWVAFVRDNNLWVASTEDGIERALTRGGTDLVRHGKACWLYFEELFNRNWRAFWWSPDSTRLVYLISDTTMVPAYTIVDNQRRKQRIESERYARPGERNPHVEAAIVDVAGGEPRPIDLSAYDDGMYLISHVSWTPDASHAVLHVQNRAQTWLDLLHAPARGGDVTRVLRDRTEAWIDSPGDTHTLDDGSWLMLSERDGFKHLYRYDKKGGFLAQVTSGEWEVMSVERIDENIARDNGWIFFTASVDSPIASNLYKIRLDGSERTRLTPDAGSHQVTLSPSGETFIDTWSSLNETTRIALRSTRDGSLIRWIDTNPAYERDTYDLGRLELVSIPTRDARPSLEGIVHYPPDFDPTRKYPIWVMTYAGPHAPTVRDSFQGGRTWEQLHAAAGIVVLRVDPYPASGKGAKSAWTTYRNMGVRELEDLEDAVAWITTNDWADADRVGLSGHSFGGYITAYALTHSTRFSAGIAGAPVTDWRDYDTIYTERYMDTPQENPDGYQRTSAVEGAKNLHGRLLIAHGTIDDNVHMHNSIRLIKALQDAGKLFEMAIYPGNRHGIFSAQYRLLQWDFVQRTMRVGEYARDMPAQPAIDDAVESEADRLQESGGVGPR